MLMVRANRVLRTNKKKSLRVEAAWGIQNYVHDMTEMLDRVRVKQFSISNEFFEKGYAAGDGPCLCTAKCCTHGVWVDVRERDAILAEQELIKRFMDETQSSSEAEWFDNEVVDDPDFASGKAVGTRVINDKCAFLDKFGRCSIQVASVETGRHKWAVKPLYCILFPIEVSNNVVSFDPMLQDEEKCCSISAHFDVPLFQACREELTHLLGEDGYATLDEQYSIRSRNTAERAESSLGPLVGSGFRVQVRDP
jgi:hypothetical protein